MRWPHTNETVCEKGHRLATNGTHADRHCSTARGFDGLAHRSSGVDDVRLARGPLFVAHENLPRVDTNTFCHFTACTHVTRNEGEVNIT